MSKDREIRDIASQLQELHLRQATLVSRLERLSESEQTEPRDATRREFAIGDRVQIRNPGLFHATKGRIVKIGTKRITVQAKNGSKIVRSPKNLILEKDD
jgi:transcription antitermination factor NusG